MFYKRTERFLVQKVDKLKKASTLNLKHFKVNIFPLPKAQGDKVILKTTKVQLPFFVLIHNSTIFYGQIDRFESLPKLNCILWLGRLPLLEKVCPREIKIVDKVGHDNENWSLIPNYANNDLMHSQKVDKEDQFTVVAGKREPALHKDLPFISSVCTKVNIGDRTHIALIDTGASLSTIKRSVIQGLIAEIKFKVNGKPMLWPFYILEDANNDVVLGLDWLRGYKVKISHCRDKVTVKLGSCRLEKKVSYGMTTNNKLKSKNSAFLNATVLLKPHCATQIEISCSKFIASSDVILQGDRDMEESKLIALGKSLFPMQDNRGLSYAINLSSAPIKLKKGTMLGALEEISAGQIVTVVQDLPQRTEAKLHSMKIESASELEAEIGSLVYGNNLTADQKEQLVCLLTKYRKVFAFSEKELGCAKGVEHHIELNERVPVKQRPNRVSQYEREIIEKEVKGKLESGLIVESNSPFASPVVLVGKKNESWRFCVDYRKLNATTKLTSYPLPRMDDLFDKLSGVKYFSKLDLVMGFHQIPMSKESQEMIAFTTTDGTFEFTRMPFGLCNAPATFQRLMDHTLGSLKWNAALVFLDDTLALGKTFEEHNRNLESIFRTFLEAGLTLKPSKCEFGMNKVKFLGHIVSEHGIQVNPEKIAAVEKFPTPKSVGDVRSFLSLCSFYRRFISFFSKLAKPLNDLLQKGVKFEWLEKHESSFQDLKKKLISAPILRHFQYGEETEIHTDACAYGVGAVLMQWQNEGNKRVRKTIAYASRSLNKSERNYFVTELECLAVVYGVEKFRPYVYGQQFKIVVDHCSLCHLLNLKNPNGRLARWALRLQPYNFTIEYTKGKLHNHADILSGFPYEKAPEEETGIEDRFLFSTIFQESPLTLPKLLEKRRNDNKIKEIIQEILKVKDGHVSSMKGIDDFKIIDGVLHHVNFDPDGRLWCICIPKGMREAVLQALHSSETGGHLGLYKTWCSVKSRFWWHNMFQHVRKFVEGCNICQVYSRRNRASTGPRLPLSPPDECFQRIGIDYIGPLPESSKKNRYVLVIVDHLSRYCEVCPVQTQTAKHAIQSLCKKVIYRHGCPREIVLDRKFTFKEFEEFCKSSGIKLSYTSVYSPSSNGLCEKVNDSLKRILAKLVGQDHSSWEAKLGQAVFAYNSAVHEVTRKSPYYVLFGREPFLKCDAQLNLCSKYLDSHKSDRIVNRVEIAKKVAKRNTERFQARQKQRFEESHWIVEFKVGDIVLHANFERVIGKVSKFLVKWTGPYRIIRKLGQLTYHIIKEDRATRVPRIIQAHARNLKLFHPSYRSCFNSEDENDCLP